MGRRNVQCPRCDSYSVRSYVSRSPKGGSYKCNLRTHATARSYGSLIGYAISDDCGNVF